MMPEITVGLANISAYINNYRAGRWIHRNSFIAKHVSLKIPKKVNRQIDSFPKV